MKILAKIANLFLLLVSFGYIALGIYTVLVDYVFGALSILFMVIPLPLYSYLGGEQNVFVNANPSYTNIFITGALTAILGSIGLLGVFLIFKKKIIGYKILFILVAVSIIISAINFIWEALYLDGGIALSYFSAGWAISYGAALHISYRKFKDEMLI